jgi:hypothetical protein
MLGKNMAIKTDFTICAPMNNGNRSFFSPKARNPSPKPVRKELFPDPSETQIQTLTSQVQLSEKRKTHSQPVSEGTLIKDKQAFMRKYIWP